MNQAQAPLVSDEQSAVAETHEPIVSLPEQRYALWQRAIIGLFVLGIFYTLYLTRAVLLPIIIAALLSFLLAPVKRGLQRLRLPGAVAAGMVVGMMAGLIGFIVSSLAEPAAKWLDDVPKIMHKIENKLYPIRQTVQEVNKAAEQVEKIATQGTPSKAVVLASPSLHALLVSGTQGLVVGIVLVVFLVFFFLATGDLLLRKLVKVLPRLRDKIKAVQISQRIQQEISRYLVTQTLINCGLGVATGIAMYLLNMPNPILWGVMVTLFNFVPYVGATVSLVVLTTVALLSFESLEQAVIVPITFLAIATIEGQLVSPLVLGRQLALNPLVIFLTIIWWAWFWGIAGALIAVPLLVITKIICDHIDSLRDLGEFLGR